MISVDDALTQLFSLTAPVSVEHIPLRQANGRILAEALKAKRDQPPFAASAMDGYAVSNAAPNAIYRVIGESAAGHRFEATVSPGEAVRIFTGAPVPNGADRIIIQEDVTRDGDQIKLNSSLDSASYIRPSGGDFTVGETFSAPRRLGPADLALLAAMNIATVPVTRRPKVALIATGDELVMPGEAPNADQIIASNTFGLAALIEAEGAIANVLPIARDTATSLHLAFELAEGADLVVTIGGASVGDHDLIAPVSAERGMDQAFYKIAMRPGKPLMAGKIGAAMMIGLPGNPVSSMVCGTVFVLPVLRAMMGLPAQAEPRLKAPLTQNIPANGPREHYMRAHITHDGIAPFERQDSSLLSILGKASALLVRPIQDPPRKAGDMVEYIVL